ncbi:MAG: hypothetical protein ACNA7K_04395 [Acholeplasmataceae bacterium]
MNKLIERYIYDVVRRLPESLKDEVSHELRSNIDDMLPDKPTEEDIIEVLNGLGEPRLLANRYRSKERALISPAYFDQYVSVLKIVLIVIGVLSFIGGSIEGAIDNGHLAWYFLVFSALWHAVFTTVGALISAFGVVTLIFAIIDYTNVELRDKPWTVKELPQLPQADSVLVSRTKMTIGLIIGSIFHGIFIVALLRYLDYIGWYNDGVLEVTFFNASVINTFIPFFIISLVLYIGLYGTIIYQGTWNQKNALLYTVYQLLSAILGIVFINHSQLIDPAFITYIANFFDTTEATFLSGINTAIVVLTILIVLGFLGDVATVWRKIIKASKHKDSFVIKIKKG